MGKPDVLRLAPEGWRQEQAAQENVRIGPVDEARLIARVLEAGPLICRRWGSPMRIVAVITEPQQVRKIQTTASPQPSSQ